MVNVLPHEERMKMRVRYYTHLATLACFLIAAAYVIGGVFLIPAYFSARSQVEAHERYRDALSGAIGLREKHDAERDLAELGERVRILSERSDMAFFGVLIEDVAKERLNGISITRLSFSRSERGAAITLSGVAQTREALLAFAEALRESASFDAVSLPVSQLVLEEDITFSIKTDYVKR